MTIPGAGDSYVQANKSFVNVKAGEDKIYRGQLLRWGGASDDLRSSGKALPDATLPDGCTVFYADSPGSMVCGVAYEEANEGEWFQMQVKGYCEYIGTDGWVEEGDQLFPCSLPGVATGINPYNQFSVVGHGGDQLYLGHPFGIALDADASTGLLTKAYISCLG